MTDEDREETARLGREAARILEDELFRDALRTITNEALTFLATADPTSMREIISAQERVRVCNELMGTLATHIQRAAINTRPKMA